MIFTRWKSTKGLTQWHVAGGGGVLCGATVGPARENSTLVPIALRCVKCRALTGSPTALERRRASAREAVRQ